MKPSHAKNAGTPWLGMIAACLAVASLTLNGAHAQDPAAGYPRKAVRVIVPAAPGGGADIIARLIGQQLGKSLGQTFLVDNRPGAANIVGTEIVAKAQPDGYTLIVNTAGPMSINPLIYAKLPYDAMKDFAPITNVADTAFVLVVNPAVAAKSVADLIALAKAKPGQLAYASWGRGSANHLGTELFMMVTQVKLLHVPYKGSGAAMPDVIAGNVPIFFDTIASAVPQIRAGRLRPLGVSSPKRSPAIPDVPTIAESGLDGFEAGSWFGFFAPAKTPREIVTKLHGEIVKAMKPREVQERLATLGLDPVGNTPAQFGEQIRRDLAKWGKVVQAAGIKPE
ncbi:MAG: tripartite tricarboxylate transporter substrate binding protein [Sulfuricaulis sp.]|nr:tripartite tricarboxylate transporter substrate binding protein [Sulfuricaulis sp.]